MHHVYIKSSTFAGQAYWAAHGCLGPPDPPPHTMHALTGRRPFLFFLFSSASCCCLRCFGYYALAGALSPLSSALWCTSPVKLWAVAACKRVDTHPESCLVGCGCHLVVYAVCALCTCHATCNWLRASTLLSMAELLVVCVHLVAVTAKLRS
jgi:hypothetical protein